MNMCIELSTGLIVVVVCLVYSILGTIQVISIISEEKKQRSLDTDRFNVYIKKP